MTLQEYNDLFKNPLRKKLYISNWGGGSGVWDEINNSNIVSEQFTIESSLCSESTLRYGCCEATCLKMQVADVDISVGDWIEVSLSIETDEYGYLLLQDGSYLLGADGGKIRLSGVNGSIVNEEWLGDIGFFKVAEVTPTADRRFKNVVAYDLMYTILNTDVKAWYESVTTPGQSLPINTLRVTLMQWLNQHLRSELPYGEFSVDDVDLVNDSLQIYPNFSIDGELSCKDVLNAICELNGVFAHTYTDVDSGDMIFSYVNLSDGESLTLDYYVDGSGTYEDYTTSQITGIIARGEEEDVGTQVGTLTNPYIIDGNPLIYGIEGTPALETALADLLDVIKNQTFIPYQVTTYGNPFLPLGTRLTINTRDKTIVSYVIKKTMTGVQALKDTLFAKGEMYQPSHVNSLVSKLQRTDGKVHKLIVDVNQLDSEINDTSTGIKSQILQMSNEILLKVDSNGNLSLVKLTGDPDTGQTAFVVKAGNFEVDAQGNVTIMGSVICDDKITLRKTVNNDVYSTDVITQELHTGTQQGQTVVAFENVRLSGYDPNWYYVSLDTNFITGDKSVQMYAYTHINNTLRVEGAATFNNAVKVYFNPISVACDDFYSKDNPYSGGGSGLDPYNPDAQAPPTFSAITALRQDDVLGNMVGFVGQAWHGVTDVIDNRFAVCREINSSMVYNRLVLSLDNSGNPSVTVDAPAEWRTAIGAAPASSREYKENVKPITEDEARKILDVDIYSFDYKQEYGGEKNQFGVIAEELEEKIPCAVNIPKAVDGRISVDYFKLIPHLIKTVQMQEERITKLESLIEKMAIEQIIYNSITAKDSPS